MTIKDYEREILTKLISKYYKRTIKYQNKEINKRISIKPTVIYKKYDDNDASLNEKEAFNQAVDNLSAFLQVNKLKYGSDYQKIYLINNNIAEAIDYLQKNFGINKREFFLKEVDDLCSYYKDRGLILTFYCNQLIKRASASLVTIDFDYEIKVLKALDFIEHNQEELYLREASMLIYGSSKVLEEKKLYEDICHIIYQATNKDYDENGDDILRDYHLYNLEQEILLKGNIEIVIDNNTFNLSSFKNGFALSSADLPHIRKINIFDDNFITIENKTSFYRFNKEYFTKLYLGGYGNRSQIKLLKMIALNNPHLNFYHFGDIDIGGFLIYQHLCRNTNLDIKLYKMGIDELKNNDYENCRQPLTENDLIRAKSLKLEVIDYMVQHNCKLEQEIVSLVEETRQKNKLKD